MLKRIILCLLVIGFLSDATLAQNPGPYPASRMQTRADSVSGSTDRLIQSNKLLHLTFTSKYTGDTTTYFRQYYVDTVNFYLMKCIIDTTFIDYFNKQLKQAVIYFNQGYEFKKFYNEVLGIESKQNYTLYNIVPEENEISPQLGKLTNSWTKESLDEKMRNLVIGDILKMKFTQRRHGY